MERYKLIEEGSGKNLDKKVSEMMDQGWVLHGSPFFVHTHYNFCQAMAFYPTPEPRLVLRQEPSLPDVVINTDKVTIKTTDEYRITTDLAPLDISRKG